MAMHRLIKSLIISIATSKMAYALPALANEMQYSAQKTSTIERVLKNFTFNYFAQYTGRSLSENYQTGATYNRFAGGTSEDGQRLDTTSSTQIFHSLSLGFKLPKNMVLSYGISYQDNLNKNVEYTLLDGSKDSRRYGRSFNNHRVSLWIPQIIQGNKASLSSSVFYERPTYKVTRNMYETAKDQETFTRVIAESNTEYDMNYQYGLGVQPTVSVYSSIAGLYHGFTASYERYFYPDYNATRSKTALWCEIWKDCIKSASTTTSSTYNLQGTMANVGAYLNYALTNRMMLKSSVQFDWNQVGDQVGSVSQWGNGLDNVGNLGASYFVKNGFFLEAGVNFALEDASIDKTAVFGSLSLSI